jgi:hypothetical protein
MMIKTGKAWPMSKAIIPIVAGAERLFMPSPVSFVKSPSVILSRFVGLVSKNVTDVGIRPAARLIIFPASKGVFLTSQ